MEDVQFGGIKIDSNDTSYASVVDSFNYLQRTFYDVDRFMVKWDMDEMQADAFHRNWRSQDFLAHVQRMLKLIEEKYL